MKSFNRRSFLKLSSATAAATMIPHRGFAWTRKEKADLKIHQNTVNFIWDGLGLTQLEYAYLYQKLADSSKITPDYYSLGGSVEELENKMADVLGKESAIFMPTGTLANHIAIRKLAGVKKRAAVQAESHIYRDSGDCLQTLSGVTLVPLCPDQTMFTLADVEKTINRIAANRVMTGLGAISIESPVRRKMNEMFDYDEMIKITTFVRERGIGCHLDGARIFCASAKTGIAPKEFASHFDTVYVSMWKNFNAPSGAILAGTKKFTENLYHTRRMFGGGLPQAWPFAAVALHYVDSFLNEYTKAWQTIEKLNAAMEKLEGVKAEKIPRGTSVYKLTISKGDLYILRSFLKNHYIDLPRPAKALPGFYMRVNPSINRMNAEDLVQAFIDAWKAAQAG